MKKTITLTSILVGLTAATTNAATVLYSENFNGEGTAGNAYNAGTTPEVNVGSIPSLNSTGSGQGGNAADTAWSLGNPTSGRNGLRFGTGGGYNWATGLNASTITSAGGFSVSFDMDVTAFANAANFVSLRLYPTAAEENYKIEGAGNNAADIDFYALARGHGRIQTGDDGVKQDFGTAGTNLARSVEFKFAFDSWDAGTTVNFTGLVDGSVVATDSFTWNVSDDMRMVLSGSAGGTLVDNVVVSTVPEPSSTALLGLGGLALILRRRRAH